ncbi:argininosuccinate lyase [Myxococcota bacterium]
MAKLWQKDYQLDALVERFTVGEDYRLDADLVPADCVGSMAHASMLRSIGILSADECAGLLRELKRVLGLAEGGSFPVSRSDEDCHTAIENHLVRELGDAGKRIHTARSRNDQVVAALRLYGRDFLVTHTRATLGLAERLVGLAREHQEVPMPGRTHMQLGMPSSVGLWAAAYAEELLDCVRLLDTVYDINNQCPLGSAASYGVPLPIDREMVADLLGFARLQNNVLYANNSRGKFESMVLDAVEQVNLTLSKLAQDLILYSMPEFAYFSLPAELCSGSSIMPQKKNPCGLELVRAKTSSVSACTQLIKAVIKALPSGYNRDFQETKAAFMRGASLGLECVCVMDLTVRKLAVHRENLERGFRPEIYATDAALELVAEGMPFRDAYRSIGLNLDQLSARDPLEAIRKKTHTGTTGNLRLDVAETGLALARRTIDSKAECYQQKLAALVGRPVRLFSPLEW